MRILIVGAGIAGMTLAALLEQRGISPKLIERAKSFDHAGYMLGLWSLGYRVLHGLGLYETFANETLPADQYEVRDNHGELIKHWSLEKITHEFGPNLSCTRPQLVKLLEKKLGVDRIQFNTEITSLHPAQDSVEVSFSDGERATFDLVVGADGMHSQVRQMLFSPPSTFDTGWGGWVWWADTSTAPQNTYVEHWGVGRFVGAYPTPAGVGVFAGAPIDDRFDANGSGRKQRLENRFADMGPLVDRWLDDLPDDDQPMFFWRLADVRSETWAAGRVALLGDAAAGILPTAGIGASMAMESAAVLADELSRVDAAFIEHAIRLYVKRRKKRVESIQDDSRRLAKMMFLQSGTLAFVRDLATHFYSIDGLAGSIGKAFSEPI